MSAPVGSHSFIYPGDTTIRHPGVAAAAEGALLKISSCCSLYVSVCVSVTEGNKVTGMKTCCLSAEHKWKKNWTVTVSINHLY